MTTFLQNYHRLPKVERRLTQLDPVWVIAYVENYAIKKHSSLIFTSTFNLPPTTSTYLRSASICRRLMSPWSIGETRYGQSQKPHVAREDRSGLPLAFVFVSASSTSWLTGRLAGRFCKLISPLPTSRFISRHK